jgi:hypothetical protein
MIWGCILRKSVTTKFALFPAYFLLIIFLISGVAINHAWSQPADDGNVCYGLTGAAYGLCNAYINAMKCGTDQQKASNKACERVQSNYEKIVGGLPPWNPCYRVTCKAGTCEDGKCPCTDNADCYTLEDCSTDGYCVDPCADLAAGGNECPCNFETIPKTIDCWGHCTDCTTNPVFFPCSQSGCGASLGSDACSIQEQVTIPGSGNLEAGDQVIFDSVTEQWSCTVNEQDLLIVPPCDALLGHTYQDISPEQGATCLCRLAQYTNELYENGISFTGGSYPYSCEPTN